MILIAVELWMLLRIDWVNLPFEWWKDSRDMAQLEDEVDEDLEEVGPEEEDLLGVTTVMKYVTWQETVLYQEKLGVCIVE